MGQGSILDRTIVCQETIPAPFLRIIMSSNITANHIQGLDWQATLQTNQEIRPHLFTDLFRKEADHRSKIGDSLGEDAFRFLSKAAATAFQLQEDNNPLEVQRVVKDRFSVHEIEVVRSLVQTIQNAALRACFADLANVAQFHPDTARLAVSSYLEAAKQYEDISSWLNFYPYVFRATKIAHRLGTDKSTFKDVCDHVESFLNRASAVDTGRCCAKFLDLAVGYKMADPKVNAHRAEAIALRLEEQNRFDVARRYWESGAQFHHQLKNNSEVKRFKIAAAETHIREAELHEQNNAQKMLVEYHLEQGLLALKKVPADRQRITDVHRHLLEVQKIAVTELGSEFVTVGDSEKQAKVAKALDGLSFQEAIKMLAMGPSPLDPKAFREWTEKRMKQTPLLAVMEPRRVDRSGRKITQRKSLLTLDPKEYEENLEAEMFNIASQDHWIDRAVNLVLPALQKIADDHPDGHTQLWGLVHTNPFVPPGHEEIFIEGLRAGFAHDYVKVVHYLAPQVENSIRWALEQKGLIASTIDDETGEQQGNYLHAILIREETAKMLGEGTVFELRGVLCEKSGYNLRNELAHGMLSADECRQPSAAMLWWLVLRCLVTCLPLPPE